MATDTSQTVYECPFCPAYFKDERGVRNHVSAKQDEQHTRQSGFDMGAQIEVRTPDIPDFDFDAWDETIESYMMDGKADVSHMRINVGKMHEEMDIPKSYLIRYVRDETEYTPVGKKGHKAGRVTPTVWDDLTETQQNSLLAVVYYPEKVQTELVDLPGTHDHDAGIYRAKNNYIWMLAHPDVDTPVEPQSNGDDSGEMSFEGLDNMMQQVGNDDGKEEEEPITSATEIAADVEPTDEELAEEVMTEEEIVEELDDPKPPIEDPEVVQRPTTDGDGGNGPMARLLTDFLRCPNCLDDREDPYITGDDEHIIVGCHYCETRVKLYNEGGEAFYE